MSISKPMESERVDNRNGTKSSSGLSQQKQYILVGVLGALFLGLMIYRMAPGEAEAASGVDLPGSAAEVASITLPPAVPSPSAEPPRLETAPELDRDPFRVPLEIQKLMQEEETAAGGEEQIFAGPDVAVLHQADKLALKGIVGSGDQRIAFINNRTVRTGSVIDGFTVLAVYERSVTLKKEKTEVELKLKSVLDDAEEIEF